MLKKILTVFSSAVLLILSFCHLEVMISTWDFSLIGMYETEDGYVADTVLGIWESVYLPEIAILTAVFALFAVTAVVGIVFCGRSFSAYMVGALNIITTVIFLIIGRSHNYLLGYFMSARFYLGRYICPLFDIDVRRIIVFIALPIIGALFATASIIISKKQNKKEVE